VLISGDKIECECLKTWHLLSYRCLWWGFEANADKNAAQVIGERFDDDELNALPFRDMETVLAIPLHTPFPGCP
jgi:hypothetical protein